MPELSRFEEMIIKMLFSDNQQHHKPHIHVFCAEHEASVGLDGEIDIAPEYLFFNGL